MHRRAACFAMLSGYALGARASEGPPTVLRDAVPGIQLGGEGRLRLLGITVYEARLWVGQGFRREAFERSPFVLELHYLRAFNRDDIARRSIEEMARQPDTPRQSLADWEKQLRHAIPNVARGDRLAGLHLPGQGAAFTANGQPCGRVDDPTFSRHFFGIWLSPQTSEPALRAALLARTTA